MNVASRSQRAISVALLISATLVPGAAIAGQSPSEIVVDNQQAQIVGTWTSSTYRPDYFGTDYVFARTGIGTSRVIWRPVLPVGGLYTVYYRLPDGATDRAPDATFTIHHLSGSNTFRIDQRVPSGGDWRSFGTFSFGAGTTGTVELTDQATGTYVIADAVKFVPATRTQPLEVVVDNDAANVSGAWTRSTFQPHYLGVDYLFRTSGGAGANTVRWTPILTESGRYFVYCRLPDGATNRAPDARFVVSSDAGSQTVIVDQRRTSNGEWVSLGSFTFSTGSNNTASVELSDQATGTYVIADAIKFVRTDHVYTVRTDLLRQTILGLGVEIQADSIGSGNVGLPEQVSGVPHDLTPSEKLRFFRERLSGFRYVRLAMGLYLRGLTPDRRNLVERYPNQMLELREMFEQAGIEGAAVEYWSPAPYWKNSNSLIGGSIRQFDSTFLSGFADAVVRDLDYLTTHGIPVSMFGLQNEPRYSYEKPYSYTTYTDQQYYDVFRHVAPRVRGAYPDVLIHNNSQAGQQGIGSALIQSDPFALSHVDAWTWHRMGTDSTEQITDRLTFNSNAFGRPVFNNEFEYLDGSTSAHRMVNTAQSLINWLVFENSPTWFWLHALKPTTNSESEGFGLGLWRPYHDNDYSRYPDISQGHFADIKTNWHALAGFLRYMPWNSVRVHVDEGVMSADRRIMAWRSPAGKLAIVLTNRGDAPYSFDIAITGASRGFTGFRYDAMQANVLVGTAAGTAMHLTVPRYAIEFWVEN